MAEFYSATIRLSDRFRGPLLLRDLQLRYCFITVAERELMLPPTLTKRLVNHARPNDVTEGYAADWTVGQLRAPAQKIADRIEALMRGPEAP